MSRFEDTLRRDLRQIADRATPSPDAWDSILTRIADQEPTQETEIIMLTENPMTTRRWPFVAAAAAVVALVVAGIALINRADPDGAPADDPVPTVAPPTPEVADDTTLGLPILNVELSAGRYSADMLGVPFTFEVPDATPPWRQIFRNDIGLSIGPDQNTVVLIKRVGSFYDADQAQDPEMTGLGSIPPDGVDAWIAANGLIVDQSSEVTVGGRTAQYRQVRIPADVGDCDEGFRPCISSVSSSADLQAVDPNPFVIHSELPWSLWFVDMGDFEPLAIAAYTDQPDHRAWLDQVTEMIDSIVLGDPAPAVEGGTARLSTFGAAPEDVETAGPLELPRAGATVAPGRYRSDSLGVPVEFDLDVGQTAVWALANDEPGRLWINSVGSDREFVAMGRLGSWYDATQARVADTTGLGSIPPDDIDGWIAQNGIIVVEGADTEVGGRAAKYRRIRLDTTPGATADFCGGRAPCLWAATGSPDVVGGTAEPLQVGFDRAQSIWVIDMDEFEPVYIFAAALLGEGDQQWFADVVQPIVDSITFGDPAPAVAGGTARVPLRVTVSAPFSGVRTDGERLADGSTSITYAATSEGAVAGEIVGTGWAIPGVPTVGHDENTFTGTIEGIGTGTVSWTTDWTGTNPADLVSTDVVTGGTGDFAGATGAVLLDLATSDNVGGVDSVAGTYTFDLVIPRSG